MNRFAKTLSLLWGLLLPVAASAGYEFSAYLGDVYVPNGDLTYQRDDTHLTFHDVSWETRSFESPVYYGLRLTRWNESEPARGRIQSGVYPPQVVSGYGPVGYGNRSPRW